MVRGCTAFLDFIQFTELLNQTTLKISTLVQMDATWDTKKLKQIFFTNASATVLARWSFVGSLGVLRKKRQS